VGLKFRTDTGGLWKTSKGKEERTLGNGGCSRGLNQKPKRIAREKSCKEFFPFTDPGRFRSEGESAGAHIDKQFKPRIRTPGIRLPPGSRSGNETSSRTTPTNEEGGTEKISNNNLGVGVLGHKRQIS